MNVSLTPELERLVHEKVDGGSYNSASEVVRAALRLLCEQDEVRELQLKALRQDIDAGVQQIERGQVKNYATPAALAADIKSRGRLRRAAEKPRRGSNGI